MPGTELTITYTDYMMVIISTSSAIFTHAIVFLPKKILDLVFLTVVEFPLFPHLPEDIYLSEPPPEEKVSFRAVAFRLPGKHDKDLASSLTKIMLTVSPLYRSNRVRNVDIGAAVHGLPLWLALAHHCWLS